MTPAAILRAAVLALPLAGLGLTWLSADRLSHQGTDWAVPVQGYDPRDMLRGHYVEFTYDWPGLERGEERFVPLLALCLEGTAPVVTKARSVAADANGCANFARSASDSVYGESSLERGRLYASQDGALNLQNQLADTKQLALIHFRLRPDGHITPLRFSFRSRTAAELKALEDAAAEAGEAAARETFGPEENPSRSGGE